MATPRKAPVSSLPRPKTDPAAMDILQAILSSQDSEKEITLDIDGMPLVLEYKELSWMAKSRCVSKATILSNSTAGEGTATFRIDIYNKECLKEMITKSPFPITDQIIERLPVSAGYQLETIIPNPFGEEAMQESAKKVQGDSLQELEK